MDQPTEYPGKNNEPVPGVLESLRAIEAESHVANAEESFDIQFGMNELDRQLDVARQSVFDELLAAMPTEIIELRAMASNMKNGDGYDDLYVHLIQLNAVFQQATGTKSPEIDHLYDLLRAVDDVATAILMSNKRVFLESDYASSSLSPDEKSKLLGIANKMIDDPTDVFDLDVQLEAMNENEAEEDVMNKFKLYRDRVLPLLDIEFARYCSLNDPVYRQLRTSVLTPLFFGWSVSIAYANDLKSLGIAQDTFEELIETIKKQME